MIVVLVLRIQKSDTGNNNFVKCKRDMSLATAKKKSTKQGAACLEFRYSCPKTMKRRPLWCTKQILWKLNLFLMKKLSFVQIKLGEKKTL